MFWYYAGLVFLGVLSFLIIDGICYNLFWNSTAYSAFVWSIITSGVAYWWEEFVMGRTNSNMFLNYILIAMPISAVIIGLMAGQARLRP